MRWSEVDGAATATAQLCTAQLYTTQLSTAQCYAEEVAFRAQALAQESATAPIAAQFEDVAARWQATQEQLRYVVAVVDAALELAATAREEPETLTRFQRE